MIEEEARAVSLEIEPAASLVAIGEQRRFRAVAVGVDGVRRLLDRGVVWTSSRSDLATVDTQGAATGANLGEVFVRASFEGFEAGAPLQVVALPVVALGLTPETPRVEVGESVHLTVTAVFSDDTSLYVTPHVVWQSAAPEIATVERARVTGQAPGETVMSASIGDVTGTIGVEVVPARLRP